MTNCPHCNSNKVRVNNHGNWTGWYCPTCKRGGSFQNKKFKPWRRKVGYHRINPSGMSVWSRPRPVNNDNINVMENL